MDRIIVISPEELKNLITEAVSCALENHSQVSSQNSVTSDTLTMDEALKFMRENGFPISKSKIYKLTAKDELPYSKFGHKLVFSRRDLLVWAKKSLTQSSDNREGILAIVRSAGKKR